MSDYVWLEIDPAFYGNGLELGLAKQRACCSCGWVSEYERVSYDARKALNKHANTCDVALYALLGESQEVVE